MLAFLLLHTPAYPNFLPRHVVAMARNLESLEHSINAFEQFVRRFSCTDKIVQPNDQVQLSTDEISLQMPISMRDLCRIQTQLTTNNRI